MVLPFFRGFRRPRDWQSQELAEFYRVEAALVQAGLEIECDRGLSDEGEPWFAFCRSVDGEVVVHVARIGSEYVLGGSAYSGVARGRDIRSLVLNLVARHRLVQTLGNVDETSNVLMHPAALLVAVVATAFFKMSEAQAGTLADQANIDPSNRGTSSTTPAASRPSSSDLVTLSIDAAHSAMVVAAILAVLDPGLRLIHQTDETLLSAPQTEYAAHPTTSQPMVLASLDRTDSHSKDRPLDLDAALDTDAAPVDLNAAPASKVDGVPALALAAVLSDLTVRDLGVRYDFEHPALQVLRTIEAPTDTISQPSADRPSLVLELSMATAGLPKIEAAAILLTEGVITKLNIDQLTHVEKLPSLLTNLIDSGTHSVLDWHNLDFGNAAAVSQSNSVVTSPIAQSVPAIEPSAVSDKATVHSIDKIDLQGVLEAFMAHTPNYGMVTNGMNVVLYDRDALTTNFDHVKSVTWDFADGSSISLVGLTSNLPDFQV